jgi:hypothetical protein
MKRSNMRVWLSHLGVRACSYTGVIMFTIAVLLSIVPGTQTAFAGCTSTSQCSSDQVCQNTAIPGIKECKQFLCNFSFDAARFATRTDMCPIDRPTCEGGACRASAGTGGGTGGGISLAGEGQTCGPFKIGNVTKSRGCQQGLQCVHGRCQKPLQ